VTDLYGSLIDLDYAVVLAEEDTSGILERTGTYPFIVRAWPSTQAVPLDIIVASPKIANIVNDEEFFEELLERFRPGIDRFKTAAREMRLALWEVHDTGICAMWKESTGIEEVHA